MDTKYSGMTNEELVKAIQKGKIPHRAKLRFENLRGANLEGGDLTGADLGGADLFGACLAGANLAGAILPDGTIYESETSSVWGPVLDENGDPIKFIEVSI